MTGTLRDSGRQLTPFTKLYIRESARHSWTMSGLRWKYIKPSDLLGDLPITSGSSLELYIIDGKVDYVVAVVGHDGASSEGDPDWAFILGGSSGFRCRSSTESHIISELNIDVDDSITRRLGHGRFHYRAGARRHKYNSIRTWQQTGLKPFESEFYIILK
jgi:hypothetical protein